MLAMTPMGRLFPQRDSDVRTAQLKASLGMAKIAVLGSCFNAAVAIVTIWALEYAWILALWGLVVVVSGAHRMIHASSILSGKRPLDLEKDERIVIGTALFSGVQWGIGIALAGLVATPLQFNVLAMLSGGMMGAAVMTYGVYPRAAASYISMISAGCLIAWSISPFAATLAGTLLITSYAIVLLRTVLQQENLTIAKIESEEARQEGAETVKLLLNDYEAQSSDWLWSTDELGNITAPSSRFAEAIGQDVEILEGKPLTMLFEHSPERDMLQEHLSKNFAFRNVMLKLDIAGQPFWWTLSATPQADGGMRGVASDVTAQKRAEAKVSYMAHYDGLTDLANRFLFNESLQRVLKREKAGQVHAVLCLDLDQFKSVNDTLGHPIGDKLLCEVSRRIEEAVRSGDLVARLGGDEFAVLLGRVTDRSDVDACARRIIEAVEQPFVLNGMQVMTSVSIGIALSDEGDLDADDLMKRADLALYSAKTNGRNRFAYFEKGMDKAAQDRRELEMDLRAALVKNEFELHYQPLVNVETGKTVSYEALVRWNHPQRGVVMPDTFIPLAEETGLIVQIGEWVMREAVAEVAKWPEELRVSVNLSPAQMRGAHLIGTVMRAVASAGINPNRLELEITETVLMQETDVNISILHKLRDFGVRISLDDFGTGYSSLNYLRSFPFDKIKIDRCFVDEIDKREDCRAIVRAVTNLANSLGMVTTAEGVESHEQLMQLRAEGCTEVQGFLFSRPSAAATFTDLRSSRGALSDPGVKIVPMLPTTDIDIASSREAKKAAG